MMDSRLATMVRLVIRHQSSPSLPTRQRGQEEGNQCRRPEWPVHICAIPLQYMDASNTSRTTVGNGGGNSVLRSCMDVQNHISFHSADSSDWVSGHLWFWLLHPASHPDDKSSISLLVLQSSEKICCNHLYHHSLQTDSRSWCRHWWTIIIMQSRRGHHQWLKGFKDSETGWNTVQAIDRQASSPAKHMKQDQQSR